MTTAALSLTRIRRETENRKYLAIVSVKTRRSRLQRAILKALRAIHEEDIDDVWVRSGRVAHRVAEYYGGRVESAHSRPWRRGTEYVMTGSFRACFSRSLRALVEQGAIERHGHGPYIRLPLKQWDEEWIAARSVRHAMALVLDKDRPRALGYSVEAAEDWVRDLEAAGLTNPALKQRIAEIRAHASILHYPH